MSHPLGIRTASMSGASAPSAAAAHARLEKRVRSRVSSAPTSVRPKMTCEMGSISRASRELAVVVALRVPVAIEVIPVLRLRADLGFELGSEGLRGLLHRFLARQIAGHEDRLAGAYVKPAPARALDEARHE